MWQDGVIPYKEDKTAKLNQITTEGPTDVNKALMGQTGQMNGDHTNELPTECKCRSEEDICDFNAAACTKLLVLTARAEGGCCFIMQMVTTVISSS